MELPVARLWSLRQSTRPTPLCLLVGVHSTLLPGVKASLFPATRFRARTFVDSGPSHPGGTGVYEAIVLGAVDVASGIVDVVNWLVFLEQDPKFLGRVKEIVEIGRLCGRHDESDVQPSYLLKVREARGQKGSEWSEKIELLVPLVDEFVRNIDVKKKHLMISPPDGLLELARRPEALRKLRPQILSFCAQQVQGLSDCLHNRCANTVKDSQASRRLYPSTSVEPSQDAYMPTRRQLHAAGRQDLIDSIMNAGGFLSVAQDLHLPSRRRPNGFWDNLRNVDAEVEWFISDSWVEKADPTTGRIVYLNEVTKMISVEKPRRGNVSDPSPVSHLRDDVGTAVMPREKTLKEAGRYDLHHAIALHGGYKAVAQALGRQSVPLPPPKQRSRKYRDLSLVELEEEIRCFMKNKGLSHFPSIADLKSEQRCDLVASLNRHGGLGVVADHMEIRPKRYGKRHWSNLEEAAGVLKAYLLEELLGDQSIQINAPADDEIWKQAVEAGALSIPTELQVMKDGRSELRYLIRKYGERELARYLNIGARKERHSKHCAVTNGLHSLQPIKFSRI